MRTGAMRRGRFCRDGFQASNILVQTLCSQTVSKLVLMQYAALKCNTIYSLSNRQGILAP